MSILLKGYTMKRVLVACEESQAVTLKFRERGFEAYSCDLQAASGGHPEWHFQGDVTPILEEHWDLIIAHPPCTHLATSGARWFADKRADGRQQGAIDFFMLFANAKAPHIAIENPIGIMSKEWREPDQIVQPYEYGDSASKATCFWLKNLPTLQPTKLVDKGEFVTFASGKKQPKWYADAFKLSPAERSKVRSKTFDGIANAIADQWGSYIMQEHTYQADIMDIMLGKA